MEKKLIIFDWGNTLMRDLNLEGSMKDWPVVELIPGIVETLEILSKDFEICVATSAAHSNTGDMLQSLKRGGIDTFFNYSFSSFELGFRKPDPRFFQTILEKLNKEPEFVLSVGDKYENDVLPAIECGMKAIWFNEKQITGNYSHASGIIYEMKQLPGEILKIF